MSASLNTVIFALIGVVLIAAAIWTYVKARKRQTGGTIVEGVVVDIGEKKFGPADSRILTPFVQYTLNGQQHETYAKGSSGSTHYAIGQTVKLCCHDADDPEAIYVVGDRSGLFASLVPGLLGLASLVAAIVMLVQG